MTRLKGNDFLRKKATNKIEKKDAWWRHEIPTEKQKKHINAFKYKYDVNALTKGQASNIISFEWQVKDRGRTTASFTEGKVF